jgi:DNA-binding LacI/PurR family transcriptional regulator
MSKNENDTSRVTIYDVAREAGVSKSLVSLVLHGNDSVSEARRDSVLKAIEKLGYRPSRAAKALAGKSSKTIGVVIDEYSNLWFVRMLEGLRQVLDEAGYQLTVSDLHRASDTLDDPVDAFLSLHVDGIVLATEPALLRNRTIPVPCVVVGGRKSKLAQADTVTNDDIQGAIIATNHLLELGHKQIGHISASGGAAERRLQGFRTAMKNSGHPGSVVGEAGRDDEVGGYVGATELFARNPKLTAIFAANDIMAAGVMAYLRDHGKRVPEDVSVMGHDNSPTSTEFVLNLSTVEYAGEEIGREAARMLLSRIHDPATELQQLVLQPELVVRKSTAAPNNK